jgi:5-methyltetrahydrofolate--homocysteine methyltransferase
MILIGEKINATRKAIAKALDERDERHIIRTAVEQAEAGADYIDVNGGDPRAGKEGQNMAWLVELVQANTDKPLAIDSADPVAAKVGLAAAKARPILNSVSLETERLEAMLPLAGAFDCMVVGLLMSDAGPPKQVDDRLANARTIVEKLTGVGRKVEEIIIDPCFLPVSAEPGAGEAVFKAIAAIRAEWPEIHIGGGLSNISFGLPKRQLVNRTAMAQAILAGMDAAITDPCTPGMAATIRAAEAVAGRDEFCMNYVMAEREGLLG